MDIVSMLKNKIMSWKINIEARNVQGDGHRAGLLY